MSRRGWKDRPGAQERPEQEIQTKLAVCRWHLSCGTGHGQLWAEQRNIKRHGDKVAPSKEVKYELVDKQEKPLESVILLM